MEEEETDIVENKWNFFFSETIFFRINRNRTFFISNSFLFSSFILSYILRVLENL